MITATLVNELRKKTNVGMMECKKALTETNGDIDAAVTYLRERGMMKAAAKADREATEGIIAARLSADGKTGILLEVNCETDFVSRNESYVKFVDQIADTLADSSAKTLEDALAEKIEGLTVEDFIKAKTLELGENIRTRIKIGRASCRERVSVTV
jgi:elongation factor Ts